MNCLTDREVSKYVKFFNEPSTVDSEWIEHISNCAFCEDRIKDALAFEKNFELLLKESYSKKEKTLFQEIVEGSNRIFIAHPIVTKNNIYQKSEIVLAADNTRQPKSLKHENITTLKTNDDSILVRIMKRIGKDEYSLYILSEDENKYKNVKVFLSFLDKEFVSDKKGKIALGNVKLPELDNIVIQIQKK